jgi:two-component system sporulation sensor kinase B
MLFVWISLWMIATILWVADWHRISTRFAGATAFAGGAGGLAATLDDFFPQSEQAGPYVLHILEVSSSLFSQVGLPYFFLLFSLASHPFFAVKKKISMLAAVTSFAPILMIYFTPLHPIYQFDFQLSLFWVGPYLFFGSVVLIHSWWREKNPVIKKARFLTNVLAIVPVAFNFVTSNVMRSLENESLWKLNALIIPILFIFFIVFGIRYGVLGIKLKVERYRLDSTLRALTSGAAILNHAIKNELVKIEALLERVKQLPQLQTEQTSQRDLQHVLDSVAHLNQMVERIHSQTQDMVLKVAVYSLQELVRECIQPLNVSPNRQEIEIRQEIPADVMLTCDRVHVTEVLSNLVINAMEAMNSTGTIRIRYTEMKKEDVLVIEDTGCGIPADQLTQILEPFYSTKNKKSNFGLGLSYCYQVMQKHGGNLNIHSELGKGTTIFLHFPKSKRR